MNKTGPIQWKLLPFGGCADKQPALLDRRPHSDRLDRVWPPPESCFCTVGSGDGRGHRSRSWSATLPPLSEFVALPPEIE